MQQQLGPQDAVLLQQAGPLQRTIPAPPLLGSQERAGATEQTQTRYRVKSVRCQEIDLLTQDFFNANPITSFWLFFPFFNLKKRAFPHLCPQCFSNKAVIIFFIDLILWLYDFIMYIFRYKKRRIFTACSTR